MPERRKFGRIPFNDRIEIWRSPTELIRGDITNLCLNGCACTIESTQSFTVGQTVNVEFLLTDDTARIKAHAEVAWNRGAAYGFRFITMDIESFSQLKRLVELNFDGAHSIEQELHALIVPHMTE